MLSTGAIGQHRHRAAIFHWKILGAGSEIANSLTVEGNFRVPATRRATNKMADATTSGRNFVTKCRLRNIIPLYCYTTIRSLTASYSYAEMFTEDFRLRRLTKSLRSGAFYRNPPPGGPGSLSARSPSGTWLSIGFFLRTIFPFDMNGNFRPS